MQLPRTIERRFLEYITKSEGPFRPDRVCEIASDKTKAEQIIEKYVKGHFIRDTQDSDGRRVLISLPKLSEKKEDLFKRLRHPIIRFFTFDRSFATAALLVAISSFCYTYVREEGKRSTSVLAHFPNEKMPGPEYVGTTGNQVSFKFSPLICIYNASDHPITLYNIELASSPSAQRLNLKITSILDSAGKLLSPPISRSLASHEEAYFVVSMEAEIHSMIHGTGKAGSGHLDGSLATEKAAREYFVREMDGVVVEVIAGGGNKYPFLLSGLNRRK